MPRRSRPPPAVPVPPTAPDPGPTLLPLPVLDSAPRGAACPTGGTPCEGCHGGCCRSFAVPVTGADVFRLTRATGRAFTDVAVRWPDADGAIARGHAPHLFFTPEPEAADPAARAGGPFVLCLGHAASVALPGSSRCRFLEETPPSPGRPRGTGRCGAYADRPAACRTYPLRFAADGRLVRLASVPARGRAGSHPAYELCPRPWAAEDVDPLAAPADLAAGRWEMEFFRQVAAAWNRVRRPRRAFPAYLEAVYAGRVADPAAAPPRHGGSHRGTNRRAA